MPPNGGIVWPLSAAFTLPSTSTFALVPAVEPLYHQAEPTIIIGIKLEQCTFRLRMYFLDWIVQAITYYFYGLPGPPSEGMGPSSPARSRRS